MFCLQIEYVILINCGGTIDLIELLQPEENVRFFILDSHRPYDLCNIYNEKQVQLLGEPSPEEEIPEYDHVFNDESVSKLQFCNCYRLIIKLILLMLVGRGRARTFR